MAARRFLPSRMYLDGKILSFYGANRKFRGNFTIPSQALGQEARLCREMGLCAPN